MKELAVYFVAGCALGVTLPMLFGTFSRQRSIKKADNQQNEGENKEEKHVEEEHVEEKPKEDEKPSEEIDPRFDFPQPTFNYSGEFKLVIGIRTDLKLPNDVFASLVGDAAIKSVVESMQIDKDGVLDWLYYGQAKITVKVPSKEEFDHLIETATNEKVHFVTLNYNNEPAAIAFGPGPVDSINLVTKHLKLV